MLRKLDFFKLVVLMGSLFALVAQAQTGVPADNDRDAQALLRKSQLAAQNLNYSGTFIYQQGSRVRASRIAHIVDSGGEIEKLEVLDGTPREYIRRNEEILYYSPESRTIWVEQRVTKDVFPAIFAAAPTELSAYYTMRKGESGRVAGYECQAIILVPRDNLRYGYKLWTEKSSGLLLRAQTIDGQGNVIEQIAFTQIFIGNIDPSLVKPSYMDTTGWRVQQAAIQQADLAGWTIEKLPPGFRKVGAVKRVLSSTVEAGANGSSNHRAPARPREVLQVVYTDGLAAISIFIEPGSQSRTEGTVQQGATNIIGKRLGEFWLTIVGEVPAAAIKQVANSVDFKSNK